MPRVIALKSFNRAYRHFCPLTFNTVFEAERLLLRPPLTFNKVFERPYQSPGPTASLAGRSDNKIPKPSGDVTRLKRGGYTLSEQLSLPKSVYQEIRVSGCSVVEHNNPNPFLRAPLGILPSRFSSPLNVSITRTHQRGRKQLS